ncbi:MAG: hypothetical protein AAB692_03640 [Patescibacteria group bacterium]
MTRRLLVGGPSSSGKSTFVLSLVEHIRARGETAEALELDQWSNSYAAFRGEIPFEGRQKRFDLAWDWKGAVAPLIERFKNSDADVVFGDLPGVLGAANSHMCELTAPFADGAVIISRTLEGLKDWRRFFRDDYGLRIVREYVSVQKSRPIVLPDMNRIIDPASPFVRDFAVSLLGPRDI